MSVSWQELVADKRRRQEASIPKNWLIATPSLDVFDVRKVPEECGLLSAKELKITEVDDIDLLLKKLASGEWSSVEVTTAFYKRAIVAHQVVNCLTEIFVERALERARWLDEQLKITGKVVGPLHGLPISLKDQISIKGLETIMGYVSWIGKYAERDAVLTELLYECGAVPFVRTNVPQTLMWPETYNVIFGRTLNPHNRNLTCGGSSGGEGALIAMRGSILGVGSDIGGSVRIPSAMNGIYGLRPSFNRLPYYGAVNSMQGQDSLPSVMGPLSISLTGIKAFVRAILSRKPWLKDPLAVRKPWDEKEYELAEHGHGKKLCFGILWNDGAVVPHPPIIRALEMTKEALIAAGHEVVDWKPYKHAELYEVTRGIWTAAGLEDYEAVTAETGEPILSSMEDISPVSGAGVYHAAEGVSAYQLWQIQKRRLQLRKEYLDYRQSTVELTSTGRPVDAIISPVAPFPAPPHGKNNNAEYTMVWNSLDYTACVFPVTRVDPVLDKAKPAHQFFSDNDRLIYELYDAETFKNAPVALQLVGGTLEEEAVIAMTEIVDAALKARK